MGPGFAVMVVVLVALVILGLPTRRRLERALRQPSGSHPLLRLPLAVRERTRRWRKQRARRHLRRV